MTITLVTSLDNHRAPSALLLEYAVRGASQRPTWNLEFAGDLPQGVARFIARAATPVLPAAAVAPQAPAPPQANPLTLPDVQTRTLVARYATAPKTVRIQVASIQP